MKMRVTTDEAEVLNEVVCKYMIQDKVSFEQKPTCKIAIFAEGIADDLRDYCSEYLLEVGFNQDYEPNRKGNALEGSVP